MSHTGIQHRIKKLKDSNILKVQGNINLNSLDFRFGYINIEFVNYDSIDAFIDKFNTCTRVVIISRMTGRYHVKLGIIGKSINDLNAFINFCLLTDRKLINSAEITFASDLSKPEYFPINFVDIQIEDTPCGRNCLECEAYVSERCFGCSLF